MFPILARLGPLTIYSYGLFLAIALVVCSFIVWKEARIRGLSEEKVIDTFLLVVISAVLSGRVGFILSHWSFFGTDLGKAFFLWKYPGLTMEGALVGAVLVSILSATGLGLSVWEVLDILSFSLSFGSLFGFLGCFLDRCLTGPTWGPVLLTGLAALTLILLQLIGKKLRESTSLAKIARRPGLVSTSYLIFQSLSFLILGVAGRQPIRPWYLAAFLLGIALFSYRYSDLEKLWLNSLVTFLSKLKTISKKGGETLSTG